MAWYDGYDVYEDFEDATLASGWAETDTGGNLTINSPTQYYDGTHSLEINHTNNTAQSNIEYDFGYGTPVDKVVLSGRFRLPSPQSEWDYGVTIFYFWDTSYSGAVELHAFSTGTPTIESVNASDSFVYTPDTWYVFQVYYNRNGASWIKIWNADHSLLLKTFTWAASDVPIYLVTVGGYHDWTGQYSYYDSLALDAGDIQSSINPWETTSSIDLFQIKMRKGLSCFTDDSCGIRDSMCCSGSALSIEGACSSHAYVTFADTCTNEIKGYINLTTGGLVTLGNICSLNKINATVIEASCCVCSSYINGSCCITSPILCGQCCVVTPLFSLIGLDKNGCPFCSQSSWNPTEGTVDMTVDCGVTIQSGQELHFYGKALENINNGEVVMYGGPQGDHVTFCKSNLYATNFNPGWILGIATHNICANEYGYVTWYGRVHGVYTYTWPQGSPLYISETCAGCIRCGPPSSPHPKFRLGIVEKEQVGGAENGVYYIKPLQNRALNRLDDVTLCNSCDYQVLMFHDDTCCTWSNCYMNLCWATIGGATTCCLICAADFQSELGASFNCVNALLKNPTGFDNPANVVVTYCSDCRQIYLSGSNYQGYWNGAPVAGLAPGWCSCQHDTPKCSPIYLYYNGSFYVWSDSSWSFDMLQIASVGFDSSCVFKFAGREPHGFMDHLVHQSEHQTIGTYLMSGNVFTSLSYVIGSTTATERRPLLDANYIKDEDLITCNAALTTNAYTWGWLTGASSEFTSSVDNPEIVSITGSQPNWNQYTGGAWTQTPIPVGSYMTIWVIAVPTTNDTASQKYRYVFLQGQSNSSTLTIESSISFNQLNLGTLSGLTPEMIAIGRIIIRYIGGNWSISQVDRISGTRFTQIASPSGNFLSAVTTDSTLGGSGTVASPLTACLATCDAPGIVRIGEGLGLNGCCIYTCLKPTDFATCDVPGIIQVGGGLCITNCTLSLNPNCGGTGGGIGCITSDYQILIGCNTACQECSDYSNYFGFYAGGSSCCSPLSNFIGYYAGDGANSSCHTNYIGFYSGQSAVCSDYSTIIGYYAGRYASCSSYSFFVGVCSGHTSFNSPYSNMIGNSAGYCSCYSSYSNMLGASAGYNSCCVSHSVFIGRSAGAVSDNSCYAVMIGTCAGNVSSSSSYSTFIGTCAGICTICAINSIFMGYGAGFNADYSNNSIFIGRATGNYACCSSCSTYIGYFAGVSAYCSSCSIFIGVCTGFNVCSSPNTLMIGNNTGITPLLCGIMATTAVASKLTINGALEPIYLILPTTCGGANSIWLV